jgi:hypothetical protein
MAKMKTVRRVPAMRSFECAMATIFEKFGAVTWLSIKVTELSAAPLLSDQFIL